MASITCTISGLASSAYMKSGSAVGTVPTIPRSSANTYRIKITTDHTNWYSFYIMAFDSYGDDVVSNGTIISGDASWLEYDNCFYSNTSFEGDIILSSHADYIYVSVSDPSPDISFKFNGATGSYGDGTGNYRWNINSTQPSLTTPVAPTITQNNNGTFTASWSAVTGSNGSGSVQYRQWSLSDGEVLTSYSTSRSVTIDIYSYGVAKQFRVEAYYSGVSKYGSATTKTFVVPSLSTPSGVKLSSTEGDTVTISWNVSSLTATAQASGQSIVYSIRKNGSQIATTTGTSYTFDNSVTSTWGTSAVTLTVVATASTVNKHYPTQTSGTSSGVSFKYKASTSASYYTGSGWVKCKIHYYNGSGWVICKPHYYIGGAWHNCS